MRGVQHAVPGSMPDKGRQTLGNSLKAVIVLKPGETGTAEEIEGFCRQRLRGYDVPQVVEFAPSLPKTPTGKVRRLALREHQGPPARSRSQGPASSRIKGG